MTPRNKPGPKKGHGGAPRKHKKGSRVQFSALVSKETITTIRELCKTSTMTQGEFIDMLVDVWVE